MKYLQNRKYLTDWIYSFKDLFLAVWIIMAYKK